jgi:hypothetical protein
MAGKDDARTDYETSNISLSARQIRWIRRLRSDALNENVELNKVTVVREAIDRLMAVGGWRELRQSLTSRIRSEPRRGRPKGG